MVFFLQKPEKTFFAQHFVCWTVVRKDVQDQRAFQNVEEKKPKQHGQTRVYSLKMLLLLMNQGKKIIANNYEIYYTCIDVIDCLLLSCKHRWQRSSKVCICKYTTKCTG